MNDKVMRPSNSLTMADGSTLEVWHPFPGLNGKEITVRLVEGRGLGSYSRSAAVDWTKEEVEEVITMLQVALENKDE